MPTYELQSRINDARDAVTHPGRFEGEPPITFILDRIVGDGGDDEYVFGDGESMVLVGRYIVSYSTQGFVSSMRFESRNTAREHFDVIVALTELLDDNAEADRFDEYVQQSRSASIEESPTYRQHMIDAGRGHLLR